MTWEEREKKIKEKGLKTSEDFANILDVSPTLVRTWVKDAVVETEIIGGVKYIKFGNSLVKLIKYYREKADNRKERKDREQLVNEKLEAEIKCKNTQNELQELKKDIQTGKYLSTEEVMNGLKKYLGDLKNLYLSIPEMVMSEIENEIKKEKLRETQHRLETKINKIMKNYVESGRVIEEIKYKSEIEINEDGAEKKKRRK